MMGTQSCWISPDMAIEIERRLPPDDRLACCLMRACGLRVSDVLALRTPEAALLAVGRVVTITERKTGKAKLIECPDGLREALRAQLRRAGKSIWLFPGGTREGHRGREPFSRRIAQIARELGYIGTVSPHSWRKCYAVELRRAGVALSDIQELLNHRHQSTTVLYAYSDTIAPVRLATRRSRRLHRFGGGASLNQDSDKNGSGARQSLPGRACAL